MGFKTFTGTTLSSSDMNSYLMKQTVIVCTSGTRPSSPNEGMVIYETDTDKLLIYTTATTGWVAPWNDPWGLVGSSIVTTPPGASTSTIVLATATFTAVKNRHYRVSGSFYGATSSGGTSGATMAVTLQDNASANFAQLIVATPAASTIYGATILGFIAHTAATGSVSYKFTCGPGTAGTYTPAAGATNPIMLLVEDIGPSAAPA